MVVKNVGTQTVPGVTVTRMIDVDAGGDWEDDNAATSADTAAIFETSGPGVSLGALTKNIPHSAMIGNWMNGQDMETDDYACGLGGQGIFPPNDYIATVAYRLGDLRAGYSKTVKFVYKTF